MILTPRKLPYFTINKSKQNEKKAKMERHLQTIQSKQT